MAERLPPRVLWLEAGGGTARYDQERYRRLLREHGHILHPGDEGYEEADRAMACGWTPKDENRSEEGTRS